ncbi:MAG: 50S ribosomal protein L9 [Verrucomicrobiales bacterium]
MPKTEVILTHNVVGLGGESDQVNVAAGYARNFLFPQGLAIPLTGANKRQLEALKKRRVERETKELSSMNELASTLSKLTLIIAVKTGEDGKMFGSVTAGTIADELRHQYDAAVDKRKIHLDSPIKGIGEHTVELRLHPDINCTLKVRVESSTPLAPEVATAQKEQTAREQAARSADDKASKKETKGSSPAKAEKSDKKTDRKPKSKKDENE